MKKKDRAARLIQHNKKLFRCPVCTKTMSLQDSSRLVCATGHSFDLSKKGALNLLKGGNTPVYTKELFEARNQVCEAGFYNPLIDRLAEILEDHRKARGRKKINILDAGCEEGSHLYGVFQRISGNHPEEEAIYNTYAGVDISKDSIHIGATNHDGILWCVADLARLPFQDSSFDVILNILSPANYGEFERILWDAGMVVKVIPGSEYLIELREIVHGEGDAAQYSNQRVKDYFEEKLVLKDIQKIRYTFPVTKELLPHFVRMTPLTWGKEGDSLEDVYKRNVTSITVDLAILIGIKKK